MLDSGKAFGRLMVILRSESKATPGSSEQAIAVFDNSEQAIAVFDNKPCFCVSLYPGVDMEQ